MPDPPRPGARAESRRQPDTEVAQADEAEVAAAQSLLDPADGCIQVELADLPVLPDLVGFEGFTRGNLTLRRLPAVKNLGGWRTACVSTCDRCQEQRRDSTMGFPQSRGARHDAHDIEHGGERTGSMSHRGSRHPCVSSCARRQNERR